MNDLFRFVLMRSADAPAPEEVNVLKASFLGSASSWQAAKAAAAAALREGKLLAPGEQAPHAETARALVRLLEPGPRSLADVEKLVKQHEGGKSAKTVVKSPDFKTSLAAVNETLLALKLLSRSEGRDAPDLTTLARGLDAISRAADGVDPLTLRPLALPSFSTLERRPGRAPAPAPTPQAPAPTKPSKSEVAAAQKRLAAVEQAIAALGRVRASDFQATASSAQQPKAPTRAGGQRAARAAAGALARPRPGRLAVHAEQAWTLSGKAVKALPSQALAAIEQAGLEPQQQPVQMMLDSLNTERVGLQELISPAAFTHLQDASDEFVGLPNEGVPSGHGLVQPVGIGDLLLVREHVKAYEGGEVAHIENVLKTEHLNRETRRLERTETTLTQETEKTKEEERDTQTTERFSLSNETSKTIQTDAELKAGVSVDAKYGPFVEVKANAEFATKSSQQEASKQAAEFSKDVVARSVSKVVERVREQRTVTTLTEFEEKYSHGFDNTQGAGNVSGVYQWVDEVVQAQIYNYGRRLLFDVTVPEPATALMLLQAANKPTPQGVTQPPPLTIDASEITESNYTEWAQLYDATGIEAPPPPTKSFSKPFANVQHDDPHEAAGTETIAIDDGYVAQYALLQCSITYYEEASLRVMVGDAWVDAFSNSGYYNMAGETGSVPIAFDMYQVEAYSMTIEIFCQRTEHAMQAWRLKTFAAIEQAFVAKEADYRQALSQAQAEAASAAYGRNPEINAQLINAELRKQCLTLVTGQEFEGFGALELSPEGFAEPNIARTAQQMPYVRFFEQAFEWDRITYTLHPYFWGWKQAWGKRMLLEDTDPKFAAFLRAGAARVVFPVRPGFEDAILHYLETGEIWNGGPPPEVNSPLYVPIVKEIQEAEGAPGEEVPDGEPWLVRLPTTLVRLRPNDDLPEWKKEGEEWVPAN
jgi:hypothetical protein